MSRETFLLDVVQTSTSSTRALTAAKELVLPLGYTLTRSKGSDSREYRLNLIGGKEETAYYTPDLMDAVNTAKAQRMRDLSALSAPKGKTMTSQDYHKIAKALLAVKPKDAPPAHAKLSSYVANDCHKWQWQQTVFAMVVMLEGDNPSFKRDRFLDAVQIDPATLTGWEIAPA
jgi:hypothetical protein